MSLQSWQPRKGGDMAASGEQGGGGERPGPIDGAVAANSTRRAHRGGHPWRGTRSHPINAFQVEEAGGWCAVSEVQAGCCTAKRVVMQAAMT